MVVRGFKNGSPAREAGIQVADALIEINGQSFASFHDAVARLKAQPQGQISLTLQRK